MATVIIDENTPHDGTAFEAFDESRSGLIRKAGAESALASGSNPSMVLAEINSFRQGVSITTEVHRFLGAGPKIWAGNIKGYTTVRTIGQTVSFTEDQDSKAYVDKQRFNPVEYVDNENYPFPIFLNDGPQQIKDTPVQVFALPFWASDNPEEDSHAHAVRGNIADGNQELTVINGYNSRILQFIDLNDHSIAPFLDEGQSYHGQAPTTCLRISDTLNTVGFFKFNGNLKDEVSNTVFDHVSGTVEYGPGPGPRGAVSHGASSLKFTGHGFGSDDIGASLTLSSSTYEPALDKVDVTVQVLAYVSRKQYFTLPKTVSNPHVFASLSHQIDLSGGTPLLELCWELFITTGPSGSRSVSVVAGDTLGGIEALSYSGSQGLDDIINLDGWNHFAFSRRPGPGVYVADLYVNGELVNSLSGSAGAATGSLGSRDVNGTERTNKLFVAGREFDFANYPPSSSTALNLPGVRMACLKMSSGSLSADQITGSVDYEFLRSTTASYSPSIMHEGYLIGNTSSSFVPFDDDGNKKLIDKLATTDNTLLTFLRLTASLNLDNDIREQHGIKSAAAGGDVYGPGQAQYGTDSIAFAGYYRGS